MDDGKSESSCKLKELFTNISEAKILLDERIKALKFFTDLLKGADAPPAKIPQSQILVDVDVTPPRCKEIIGPLDISAIEFAIVEFLQEEHLHLSKDR